VLGTNPALAELSRDRSGCYEPSAVEAGVAPFREHKFSFWDKPPNQAILIDGGQRCVAMGIIEQFAGCLTTGAPPGGA